MYNVLLESELKEGVIKMRRFLVPSILLIIALLAMPSCAKTVPQQEYDRLNQEYDTLNSELSAVQKQLVSRSTEYEVVQAQYIDLNSQYKAIQAQNKDLNSQYEAIQAKYNDLNSQYKAIQADYKDLDTQYVSVRDKYNGLIKGVAGINESDVEQALFKLINRDRTNNKLNEFMWGDNLYGWAIANSRNMAKNQHYQYSDYGSYEQVYWAAGYGTADSIANDTLNIWRNSLQYDKIFLNQILTYATVAVYKSGGILYITFISDTFR